MAARRAGSGAEVRYEGYRTDTFLGGGRPARRRRRLRATAIWLVVLAAVPLGAVGLLGLDPSTLSL